MIRLLHAIKQDERGTSLVEMGIALPILCFMVLGTVDVSIAFADKLALEQSAYRALERIQASGYVHSTATPNPQLAALEDDGEAAAGAGSTATASAYLECRNGTQIETKLFNEYCQSGWTGARYVALTIAKTHTPSFGGITGTYPLTGRASVRVQ